MTPERSPPDASVIRDRIREAILREAELPEQVAEDVAFHMTDWLDDLAHFQKFYSEPDQWQDEQIMKMLIAFLLHVPNHLAAASKLLTEVPVTDVFGVGAVDNEPDE